MPLSIISTPEDPWHSDRAGYVAISPFAALRADPRRPDPVRPSGGGTSALPRNPRWVVGLDLGQAHDFTALVAVEIVRPVARGSRPLLHVPLVTRAPLGTPYPIVVRRALEVLQAPPVAGDAHLVADATGVGRPVLDLLRTGPVPPIAITITGGDNVHGGGRNFRVPKRDLVSVLQLALHDGRLKIAAETDHADTLVRELADFRVKITAGGSDRYGAWREGAHDDLVLALALSVWWSERIAKLAARWRPMGDCRH